MVRKRKWRGWGSRLLAKLGRAASMTANADFGETEAAITGVQGYEGHI